MIKGLLVGAVLGLPILWLVLWLMETGGSLWWLYTWLALVVYQLLVMWIAPNVIMPLFNKFTPLEDDALKQRVMALMNRAGFKAKGFFVMDGSRRSAHSNAFFTGFGAVTCAQCGAGLYSTALAATASNTCQNCSAGSYFTGFGLASGKRL
jgi:STE24 endopeptidase